ncbi:MAG: xanthine dehydrogenase family protein subunit M [Elusimicrobia bacterium]|nr:xanthine dehydrogenase family protein subunit M [Elusimicrobiota bacterium]
MRGAPETMAVLRPKSGAEAVKLYGQQTKAVPLAGGTDFMVLWNLGLLNGRTILDLSGVRDWRKIAAARTGVLVGSLATHAEIGRHPTVRAEFPLLVSACATIGAAQIQNRGTLGGNIANASPAGDTFPSLLVYEAVVRTVSPRGKRKLPISEVFAGVKRTTLGPGELIEAVELPFLDKRPSRRLFRKVGTRLAQAISKTVAAGILRLGKGGVVEDFRFALGSMAPTAVRLTEAESAVVGFKLTPAVVDEACRRLERSVSPIDDIRSTREYRLEVSRNILRSFLEGNQ